MSPKIVTRRANPNDLESLLEIRRTIYGGIDHVKSYFNVWLQNPRCYVYVAEIDSKVVALYIRRIMEDGQTAYGFSNSTALGYEGLGIQQALNAMFLEEIKCDFPSIDTMQGVAYMAPGFQRGMQKDPSLRIVEDWFAMKRGPATYGLQLRVRKKFLLHTVPNM